VAVAVSILVLVALVVIASALVVLFRRLLWPGSGDSSAETPGTPYGGLTEPGPVGELGQLSPGADLSQTGTDSEDMYGE
jgi:hypothetical protein